MILPGFGELVLIFGVVVLLFGGKKLPELGRAIGESIKNFRQGVKDDEETKKLTPGSGDEEKKNP